MIKNLIYPYKRLSQKSTFLETVFFYGELLSGKLFHDSLKYFISNFHNINPLGQCFKLIIVNSSK